jgi:AcrR family transcriptional regulator
MAARALAEKAVDTGPRIYNNALRMSVRSTASPAKVRQEQAREAARRDILLAAAGVFARRGYAASTLAELAQAAGFAAPSLYRYFESKQEIFRSLVELMKADLHATFDAPVDPALPLARRLEALLALQFELTRSRRDLVAFLVSTPEGPGRQVTAEMRLGASLYEKSMGAWLERHAAAADLRCPVAHAARVLAAIGHAFHQSAIFGPTKGLDPAAEARLVVDLALHGIVATPAA